MRTLASVVVAVVLLGGLAIVARPRAPAPVPAPRLSTPPLHPAVIRGPQQAHEPRPSSRWRGRVVDPDGRAAADIDVTLGAATDPCAFPTATVRLRSDRGGAFEFDPPARASRLEATHPDFSPASAEAVDGVTLRLRRAAWIEGYATSPATVRATQGLRTVAATRTEEDGTFRLGPLPTDAPVALHVVAEGRLPWHERQPVLREGESLYRVVNLEPGLVVRGAVEPAVAGVRVRANQGDGRELAATTDECGRFEFGGLRPGQVRLIAFDEAFEPSTTVIEAGERAGLVLKRRSHP
jgi:hypothetical protein